MTNSARALFDSSLVWDNHSWSSEDPTDESPLFNLPRYKRAGVDVIALNIGYGKQGIEEHIRLLAHFRRWISMRPDEYLLIDSVADIDRARSESKLGIMFDMEGANGIADQPSLLQLYYDLGVRWMLMAYNLNNRVGGGCQDEDTGLTAFGRDVIDEMARVGMVACCSHTGYRKTMDLLSYSANPVIFSHSNARAVHDHPRNITDEQMDACARTGGVVGINGIGIFLGENDVSSEAFVRHLDHIVQRIGPQHVGLGLDCGLTDELGGDGLALDPETFPANLGYQENIRMVPPGQLEEIFNMLIGMGYRTDDLKAIAGGNLKRVAEQVWRPSQAERSQETV